MSLGFYQQEDDSEDSIRFITKLVADILVVLILAIFLVQYMGMNYQVIGHSMEPTFQIGDTVLVDQIAYKVGRPHRFDVVLFQSRDDEEKFFMKRVIGLPGETVQIQNGSVYINDRLLEAEDSLGTIHLAGIASSPVLLGKGEYFVIGDNSDSSEDSRFSNIGNIQQSDMIGKIWFRLEPFKRMGLITHRRK